MEALLCARVYLPSRRAALRHSACVPVWTWSFIPIVCCQLCLQAAAAPSGLPDVTPKKAGFSLKGETSDAPPTPANGS